MNMTTIDIEKLDRKKAYEMFKSFQNATYGCCVEMDVTKLLAHSKKNNQSFFINFLYIVSKTLNEIEEFRMRLVEDKPVIFERIAPGFTVMTNKGFYINAATTFHKQYKKFYDEAYKIKELAKQNKPLPSLTDSQYPELSAIYNTSLPWLSFVNMSHPIPANKSSQTVPRVCWGKYFERNGKILMNLNITISHVFVDGYPLSKAFLHIQELLDNVEKVLK